MKEIQKRARQLMKNFCEVCPRCNGIICAEQVPGMGGLGTGASFRANLEALDRVQFNMRLIHDVTEPDTNCSILGRSFTLPLLAAPIGGVSFNMGGAVSEEDYIHAIIHGCREKGIMGCTGDGVPAFIHKCGFEAIEQADGHGIPFIKPWEDEELYEKLGLAEKTGCNIIGMDIDAAGLLSFRRMGRPVSPRPVEKLKEIIKTVKGASRSSSSFGPPMKFILKGIMTPDNAILAVEAGADGIVVSNHGGRVLDFAPGAAEVLGAIADQVKGKITILADGGVRTGGDMLKLLALGADAVMIGRPFAVAAVGGLQKGVETYIDTIHKELKQAMVLTGTHSVQTASKEILFRQ